MFDNEFESLPIDFIKNERHFQLLLFHAESDSVIRLAKKSF